MTVYIDTEFNGNGGKLISLAMISDITGWEFYEVLTPPAKPDPWVKQHVIPVLGKKPISRYTFRFKFEEYVRHHKTEDFVADWPEDLTHFLSFLWSGKGKTAKQLNLATRWPLVMALIRNPGPDEPETPHNALSDAKCLLWNCVQSRTRKR